MKHNKESLAVSIKTARRSYLDRVLAEKSIRDSGLDCSLAIKETNKAWRQFDRLYNKLGALDNATTGTI